MKRIFIPLCITMLLTGCSQSGVKLQFEGFTNDTIIVSHAAIADLSKISSDDDPLISYDTLVMQQNIIRLKPDASKAEKYVCISKEVDNRTIEFFTSPTDNLNIKVIRTDNGIDYIVTGSTLMEDISAMEQKATPLLDELYALPKDEEHKIDSLKTLYRAVYYNYLKSNPNKPAAIWAINRVPADTALLYIDSLGIDAKKSILAPLYESTKQKCEKFAVRKKAEVSIVEGATAPDFSLPDTENNLLTLQSFRGKWVVLDFWGTWCPWCIKGFDEMKNYYNRYNDKCTFVGICCRDKKEKWLEGISKYELPWINLFSDPDTPAEQAVEAIYAVQGYPTKIILTPEGTIAKIVLGEDPAFYQALEELLK